MDFKSRQALRQAYQNYGVREGAGDLRSFPTQKPAGCSERRLYHGRGSRDGGPRFRPGRSA